MNYCNNCGVELEENVNSCPLCGKNLTGESVMDTEDRPYKEAIPERGIPSDFVGLTKLQRQKVFWQLSGITLISGMIVTLIIDLIINRSVTWSRFPMSACLALFVNISVIFFLRRRIALAFTGNFLSTSMLLVLFDVFNKNIGWSTKLGIPLVFSFFLVVYLLIKLVRHSKQRGINLIAYFLMAAGILSLSVEGIISLQTGARLQFHWSVIVLASVMCVSAILLFIHFRLRKGTDLKRFFHI